ncbi:MAG: CHASE domain-containing protein [Pseudazoarcus pumilus]|nr:CHASE domain-containing protein [Pseudazoarcus pumilus]
MQRSDHPPHTTAPPPGPSCRVRRFGILTALYLLAAWAGHLVALSTGYASPLWPAAGIALAGLLVWGIRLWPAIWLGGLLTELFITPSGSDWPVSVGIACGIALQALAGAWLAHRELARNSDGYSDRALLRLILLCGPLACLVASGIGIATLLASGALIPAQLLDNWLLWWAGDTVGVLLFTPLALALWPGNAGLRQHWEGGWRVAVIPAVTAALLLAGLVQMTRLEASRVHAEAMRDMDIVGDRSLVELSAALQPLHGMVRLFEASDHVTRDEFRRYAESLRRHEAITGIDWAPRVAGEDRSRFEATVRADGLSDYFVFDLDAAGEMRPAASRQEHFPVLYTEPFAINHAALGLDHAQSAERRAAMARALAKPGTAHVLREELLRTHRPSLLVFLPVSESGTATLAGYVVGVLDLQHLVSGLVDEAAAQQLAFRVYDVSPGAPSRVLYDTLPADAVPDLSRELSVGGLSWRVDMAHVGTQQDATTLQTLRVYLGFAVFASLLVAFAVLGSAGRNAATNARVRERTTELDETLARLRDREAEERAVLDNIVECVITIATDGHVININRAVEPMFGYTPDEVIGRNVAMLMSGADSAAHDDYIRRYLDTGERRIIGRNREVVGRHKDGRAIALELAVSEYVFGERRVFTGTLRDISERKALMADLTRAREQADEANRAKSAFLAAMSHEIRTPMNGVVGLSDVLACSSLDEYQRDLVRTIRESSTALLTLIDDILDFSKIEAGRLEIELRPLALTEVVEGVCASLSPIAVRRGVDVSLYIDPTLPVGVISDEVRLRQVLYNIVGNAIKFSAGRPDVRGVVSLRVVRAGDDPLRVCFSVADNGIGIAPERLHVLFRPFTQAETSTTRRYGGTGLGLAICCRLVDMLGGEISVDSAVGRGATFRVTLPLEVASDIEAPPLPVLDGVDCLIGPCCGADADIVEAYLARAGARTHRPADTAEALDVARDAQPPLIVIDCTRDGDAPASEYLLPGIDARGVRLLRGRGAGRLDPRRQIAVDANVLRRATLLRAVAVAAGRASPEAADEADAGGLPRPASPPDVQAARAEHRLILVAEDNEINQKVILHQLALLGYAAEVAEDGAQALSMWRRGDYALLLTDLHMPQLDGYALTAAIRREERPGSHAPILALTANALRGEERRAQEAGMDAYLTKPVQLDVLRRTLEQHLPGVAPRTPAPTGPSAVTAKDSALPLFDVSVLEELVGDDQQIVREFLHEFRRSAKDLAESLHTALDGGWPLEAGNAAHKLKSAARSVGALALGEECAIIEREARQSDADALAVRLPGFDALLRETGRMIDAHLAGNHDA